MSDGGSRGKAHTLLRSPQNATSKPSNHDHKHVAKISCTVMTRKQGLHDTKERHSRGGE